MGSACARIPVAPDALGKADLVGRGPARDALRVRVVAASCQHRCSEKALQGVVTMRFTSLTDRRSFWLLAIAAPLAVGSGARADETSLKNAALALAQHARHFHEILELERLVISFWHLQTHVLLDGATARFSASETDPLRAAATRLREKAATQHRIGTETGTTPLRRLQLKNVIGTIQHISDETEGIIGHLVRGEVEEAIALHRERSVPLFESLQRDVEVATNAIAGDVSALAAAL
jgi:hypothetical protein